MNTIAQRNMNTAIPAVNTAVEKKSMWNEVWLIITNSDIKIGLRRYALNDIRLSGKNILRFRIFAPTPEIVEIDSLC